MTLASPQQHDLIPLADRIRYMQTFRFLAAAALLACWLILPAVHAIAFPVLAAATGAYLLLSLAGEAAWRGLGRRSLPLFGVMLIVDGVYLGWLTYMVGGGPSPVRALILLHVIAVALLASFRTGMKIALWHSLLAVMAFHAQEAGIISDHPVPMGSVEYRLLVMDIVIVWAVAIATSTYAALNERELRRRRYDLEALARLAFGLETTTEPLAVGERLLEAIVDDFGFERAALIVASGDGLSLLAHRGLESRSLVSDIPVPDSTLGRAAISSESLRITQPDPERDHFLAALFPRSHNLLIVPMHAEGRTIAFLIIEHGIRRGSRVERRVVAAVERFASQSALALNNAWLLEQVRRLAGSDALTGLPNRRHFEETLDRELARSLRTDQPVNLLMLDIDHFKRINDTRGHQAGDAVLRAVGRRLSETVRTGDVVARYGGEEFAIVMPAAQTEDAVLLADRIRRALETLDVPVTVSIGIATYLRHADDASALIEAADQALYESKRSGRDRATVSAGERRSAVKVAGADV
jgi:two-component system, cell cycle response regulator